MKSKRYVLVVLVLSILVITGVQIVFTIETNARKTPTTESVAVRAVGNDIAADGTIHSQNEATLHFQTAGTVVYLPFKIGDSVSAGQTIASLDQRAIEDAIKSALAGANNQQISFDTVNDQNGDRALTDTGLSTSAFRQLQTSANTLTQAQLAVDIQQIAEQQASLTAPFSGVITGEDITSPNVNVTTTTSFSIADPTTLVFRANVSTSDIDFIRVGSQATIHVTGQNKPLTGTVERIYPQQTVVNGQNVYQVDIASSTLSTIAKLGQTGAVSIKSSADEATVLVPTWTIVGHSSVWVIENNQPVLKHVTVGQSHGNMTEILNGLALEDRVIVSPASIAAYTYSAL